MDFLKKLFSVPGDEPDVDYYREGVELLEAGLHHEALTSFRLALREAPGDVAVLQQIAITHTRIGMTEEAAKVYREVLAKDPKAPGAHYGLAFLLLHHGDPATAVDHLRAFLESPPSHEQAQPYVVHARETLAQLEDETWDDRRENAAP